jgi:RNA recognition motif-containing protein
VTGKSRGSGFVEMPRAVQARVAIRELNARAAGGGWLVLKGNASVNPVSHE